MQKYIVEVLYRGDDGGQKALIGTVDADTQAEAEIVAENLTTRIEAALGIDGTTQTFVYRDVDLMPMETVVEGLENG